MAEERDNIVVLIDEDGEEEEFEFVDSIEINGSEYVILSPVSEDELFDIEEEIVILKVEINEDGEETYVTIEDENELDTVFEEFKMRIEDGFTFDIDEDYDDEDYDDYEDEDEDEDDYDEE